MSYTQALFYQCFNCVKKQSSSALLSELEQRPWKYFNAKSFRLTSSVPASMVPADIGSFRLLLLAALISSNLPQPVVPSFHFSQNWHVPRKLLQEEYNFVVYSKRRHMWDVLCFLSCQDDRTILGGGIFSFLKCFMHSRRNQYLLIHQETSPYPTVGWHQP